MHTQLENSQARQGQSKKSNDFNSPVSKHSQVLVKAQLEMTTPGDSDEQEADEMADSIVSEGKIARSVSSGHPGGGVALPSQFGSRIASFQGQGSSITGDLKTRMESGFGRDFSNVRLHTDDAAAEMSSSISAKAFTYGNDIFFNRGQYSPDTKDGQHLLAHELTHVVQGQRLGRVPSDTKDSTPVNAQNIGQDVQVTSKGQEDFQRSLLSVCLKLLGHNYSSVTLPIYSDDKKNLKNHNASGLEIIEKRILPACSVLTSLAQQFNDNDTDDNISFTDALSRVTGWSMIKTMATKQFVKQLVQQLYNTLSQVSVAMDMLPKSYDSNMAALKKTAWVKCRNKFVQCVKQLAALAKNPAIGVLMYEGTYYPNDFPNDLTKATNKLINEDDSSMVLYHGAVCNNAAYGSVMASGTDYQYESDVEDTERLKIVSLAQSGTFRSKWENYNLQGSGVGSDALDRAKQGDVVLFWRYSKIDDEAIKRKNKVKWSDVSDLKQKMDNAQKEKNTAEKKKSTDLESKKEVYEKAKKEYDDAYADYVLGIDHDAHHTEIIVGIRENPETHQKEYLLSGAHGSADVNGFAREKGKLAWKSAKDIRGNRIMRCLPMDNESDLITVDIPDIMKDQKYNMQRNKHIDEAAKQYAVNNGIDGIKSLEALKAYYKKSLKAQNLPREQYNAQSAAKMKEIDSEILELKKESEVKRKANVHNEYSWRGNPVYVYENRNTLSVVEVSWLEIPQDNPLVNATSSQPVESSPSQE